MNPQDPHKRLSAITTHWTILFQAQAAQTDGTKAALEKLLERYGGAVYRYLLGAVRDADAAGDLAQEFALRFVRGDFRRANPERGRFRDYLKTALINLVNDFHRMRQAWPRQLAPAGPDPAAPVAADADSGTDFVSTWREEVLDRAWKALAEANPGYHAALRFRIDNPEAVSTEMAAQLASCLGKPVTAASARKMLERAHVKYADLLLEDIAFSLEDASPESLEKELSELDLLKYCRSALQRRQRS